MQTCKQHQTTAPMDRWQNFCPLGGLHGCPHAPGGQNKLIFTPLAASARGAARVGAEGSDLNRLSRKPSRPSVGGHRGHRLEALIKHRRKDREGMGGLISIGWVTGVKFPNPNHPLDWKSYHNYIPIPAPPKGWFIDTPDYLCSIL